MALNPSTLIMKRDQDFPQLPSIPLSSKLDGALTLCFPSTKAVTKSQSHALARLGSPWHSFRLGPRAACKLFATLAQSSQPVRAGLSSGHRSPGRAFPLQAASHAFGFASRGNMFSPYPGVKQSSPAKTIQSTAQSMTSQGRELPWS